MATKAKDGRTRIPGGVHIKKNNKGEFYGLVAAENGHILMKTSESYSRRVDCISAMKSAGVMIISALSVKGSPFLHDHTKK